MAMIAFGRTLALPAALALLALWNAQPSMAAPSCPNNETDLQALVNAGGTVTLSCAAATTVSFTSTISITKSVTLDASSSPAPISFNGSGSTQLFSVSSDFTVRNLTLANGHTGDSGGAMYISHGRVAITNSTLSGNSAAVDGGAIFLDRKGGFSQLTITSSTLTGNSATRFGGALWSFGDASITGSTIAENSSAQNYNGSPGAAIAFGGFGLGSVAIGGSIVAENTGGNCDQPVADNGYNLEDDKEASCGFSTGSNDVVDQNPRLGPLSNNAGPTETMALLGGSPAIDRVPTTTGLCASTDQRGTPRPDDNESACDMGAYESEYGAPSVYWASKDGTIGTDTVDGSPFNFHSALITGANQPMWLAVDRDHIYWASPAAGTIGRANLDGSEANPSFITNLSNPQGVAIDGQHIYWVNTYVRPPPAASIGRADLDGSNVDQNFIPNLESAAALAVDPRHLYWAENNNSDRADSIGRASLDGSGVDENFIGGDPNRTLIQPEAVAVDGQYIYFVNSDAEIARDTLDGNPANLKTDFIIPHGNGSITGIAVDYQHLYWSDQLQNSIGRANLDGSDIEDSFIGGAGNPRAVAVTLPSGGGPVCLRQDPPPPAPSGGAVFARPLDSSGANANVVVLPAGSTWSEAGACAGTAQGAADVMSHPTSIAVGPGAAVLLRDKDAGLTSAWGAQDVAEGGPAPVLFPGRADWRTTEADVLDPQALLKTYDGCRACSLPKVDFTPGQRDPNIAYQQDLRGAELTGATLAGDFTGWNLSGANLSGATMQRTVVDRAVFDGSDLRGAHLVGLQSSAPPSFRGVRVGPFSGSCTVIQDTNLLAADFLPAKLDAGCESSPVLPGSTVPFALISSLLPDRASFDFGGARFVVQARTAGLLAGANLAGIHLSKASFLGFPANFSNTHFDGASLQDTRFQLADLSGATFEGAQADGAAFTQADLNGAVFSGGNTSLTGANFVEADVSGAKFQSADLSGADFSRALAIDTDFNSVIGNDKTVFNGAHIYGGDGGAFKGARQLEGVDFGGAVLAGSTDGTGGFDLTDADLSGAKFDGAQCIACNFTRATLSGANFTGTYMPGATLSGGTLTGAHLYNAWLYCGSSNSSCPQDPELQHYWDWPLALGSDEVYASIPFADTDLTGVSLNGVTTCPDGSKPDQDTGCQGHLLPDVPLKLPLPCSSAALDACPTATSTLFDATSIGSPVAVVPAVPPTWATAATGTGYYVALDDGTIRKAGNGATPHDNEVVAGSPGQHCASSTDPCGDRGSAKLALLGTPDGLALGLDGSLYVTDPALHRVRRIDPSGNITTVAGSGHGCSDPAAPACGDGGPATAAALAGPYGVWVNPSGELFIADGRRGIREVRTDGTITTTGIGPGTYDVRSIAGDAAGNLYAATNAPDYLIKISLPGGRPTIVVGNGTSGYNGDSEDPAKVEINKPQSLSVGLDGKVVFADSANSLIRAYVPPSEPSGSGHVIDLGGQVSNNTPQSGYNGDAHWADQTLLDHPQAVTVTRGVLYVIADTNNHAVRQIGPGPAAEQLGAKLQRSLITCKTVTKTVRLRHKARTRRVKAIRCRTMRIVGKVKLRGTARARATLRRGRVVYATGTAVSTAPGRLRMLVTRRRPLRPGRYTLTLRRRRHHRFVLRRMTITLA